MTDTELRPLPEIEDDARRCLDRLNEMRDEPLTPATDAEVETITRELEVLMQEVTAHADGAKS